jgi:uracil-DNA glycosylase family 4
MTESFVGPSGSLDSPIAFVGEQPAHYEVKYGKPFMGPAGRNLDECLQNSRIPRSRCYLTNVIKDVEFDLERYFKLTTKTAYISTLGEKYLEILRDELRETKANVIVALGNTALFALCSRVGINAWRGSVIESTLLPGRKIIPTLHPAVYTDEKVFANPAAYLAKYLITIDLKKAWKESEYPEIKLTPRHLVIEPSFYQAMSWLEECKQAASNGATIYWDIELTPKTQELSCISFATSPTDVVCIPFVNAEGDYYTAEQEYEIMLSIEELLSNEDYQKGGQNVVFDSHFLLRKYGIRTRNIVADTMVAQHILYPDFGGKTYRGKSLEFITSMWTDVPYYKRDGKLWLTGVGEFRNGWNYNCLDSIACADSFPKQLEELEERGNQEAYERQLRLIPSLTYMMEKGIRIDTDGMRRAAIQAKEKADDLAYEAYKIMNKEINLASPKQLCEYFYVDKRIEPYYSKTGKPAVDKEALTRIANKGFKEASLILEIRQLEKQVSTFLNVNNVDPDGRMRCSFNPVGTRFSRISSSDNIFGTGVNLQNIPHDVLSYYIADPEYVIYSLDMSQIESRIVAYVGNITQMREVYENGLDIHRMTGSLIFGVPYDEVSNRPGSSNLGNGKQSQRDWAKRANHGFNYGYGYKAFSLSYEIPEREAKFIYDSYHAAYPGLKGGYWKHVENSLKSTRTLENLFGRKVQFLGKWSEKFLNEAYACIPQGTCGDLVNEWGLNFVYYNSDPLFKNVELLMQVHDSISFQVPLSLPLEDHARILISIKESLEQELQFKHMQFSVPVDLVINSNLNKDTGIELKGEKFSNDPDVLEVYLQDAILTLGV